MQPRSPLTEIKSRRASRSTMAPWSYLAAATAMSILRPHIVFTADVADALGAQSAPTPPSPRLVPTPKRINGNTLRPWASQLHRCLPRQNLITPQQSSRLSLYNKGSALHASHWRRESPSGHAPDFASQTLLRATASIVLAPNVQTAIHQHRFRQGRLQARHRHRPDRGRQSNESTRGGGMEDRPTS